MQKAHYIVRQAGRVFLAGFTAMILLVLAALGVYAQSTFIEPARIDATFFQPLSAHQKWSSAQWDKLFVSLKTLKISRLIVQWSVHDEQRFYAELGQASLLENVLAAADKNGIQIVVGLVNDSIYWDKMQTPLAYRETYFQSLQDRSLFTLNELAPRVLAHSSFQGWYIPQEIDDINWRDPAAEKMLTKYLLAITDALYEATPTKKIFISGFVNAGTDPAYVKGLWSRLLESSPHLDGVLFQDGIGAGKLKLPELSTYFDVLERVARERGRSFQPVVEVFRQIAGEPIDHQAFRAVPAPFARVLEQLRVASKYSSSVAVFSAPEYMLLEGNDDAKALSVAYLQQLQSKAIK